MDFARAAWTLFIVVSVALNNCHGYISESWALLESRPTQPSCVRIPRNFTLCHGIEYDRMRLPNLLDHETMNEVIQQSHSWVPLVQLSCHDDTKLFLCSVFAPVCLESVDRHIQPCRSLCQQVQQGCERRMRQYGFPWPEMLSCDKYPRDNDMCIKPRDNHGNRTCVSCGQVGTYENILDNFCTSKHVIKAKIKSVENTHMKIRRGRSLKRDRRRSVFRNADVYFSEEENSGCPCDVLENERRSPRDTNGKGNKRRSKQYLVMANEGDDGKYIAKLILPWKKEKRFKRAVRMFRKLNCETLGHEIRDRARRQQPFGAGSVGSGVRHKPPIGSYRAGRTPGRSN